MASAWAALWLFAPRFRGTVVARYDLSRGKREIKFYGLPPISHPTWVRILKDRYHVQVNQVSGCIVADRKAAYWDGYNSIVEKALNREFGLNVMDTSYDAAVKEDEQLNGQ